MTRLQKRAVTRWRKAKVVPIRPVFTMTCNWCAGAGCRLCDETGRTSPLFIGVYPAGLVYCDKRKEVRGDYKRVAFLPYRALVLEVEEPDSDLLDMIRTDAERMQAMRGQEFAIAGNMAITLGGA